MQFTFSLLAPEPPSPNSRDRPPLAKVCCARSTIADDPIRISAGPSQNFDRSSPSGLISVSVFQIETGILIVHTGGSARRHGSWCVFVYFRRARSAIVMIDLSIDIFFRGKYSKNLHTPTPVGQVEMQNKFAYLLSRESLRNSHSTSLWFEIVEPLYSVCVEA